MNHPDRRCCDGFVPWLTSVPVSRETGLSKRAEMPPLCQPRATGADVSLCVCDFSLVLPLGDFSGQFVTNHSSYFSCSELLDQNNPTMLFIF